MATAEETSVIRQVVEEGKSPTDGQEPLSFGRGVGGSSIADEELARLVQGSGELSSHDEENILGFPTVDVPAFSVVTLVTRPNWVFRPNRLIIPEKVAASFMVLDLKVGKDSQLMSAHPVAAVVFGEHDKNPRMRMDTLQMSMDAIIVVRNITPATQTFTACLIGRVIR